MFEQCLEVPNKRKKEFDRGLCLVCQKKVEKPKRGKAPVTTDSSFTVFVEVCENFISTGDVRYHYLQEEIRNKDAAQLKKESYCFHPVCKSDFWKILGNQKRNRMSGESNKILQHKCVNSQHLCLKHPTRFCNL